MSMRPTAIALALIVTAGAAAGVTTGVARADTFSGFSGVDRPYLVNQDRVCKPILVANSAAAGAPSCEKATADVIAHLSIKPPIVQSGAKATFVAEVSGRTITVSRKTGGTVVTWSATDPIARIVELYASQYDDRVAVAYNVRRLGKEVTDVVAFDLGQGQTAVKDPVKEVIVDTRPPDPGSGKPDAPADPAVAKALADARAAPKAKSLAAWRAVLALDAASGEALYQTAALELAARRIPDAMVRLQALADSTRPDAIEWLVEARFSPAFASVRGDAKFRTVVGLDRKPATTYERLMGFGGQWEQTGTSCERPEVRFVAQRDRNVRIRVKTTCEGSAFDTTFRGTWRLAGDRVVLQLPTKGRAATAADETTCGFEPAGDEEALRCVLGRDIDFLVLPTRR